MDIHRDDENDQDKVIVLSPTSSSSEGEEDRLEEVPVEEGQKNNSMNISYHDERETVPERCDVLPPPPILDNESCFASLPSAAEIRRNSKGPKYRLSPETARWLKVVVAVFVVFCCVLAISVGVNRKGSSAPQIVVSEAEIESLLLAHGISSREDMYLPDSPHRQAISWMAQDASQAGHGLPSPASPQFPSGYRFIARYIMSLCYYSWQGPKWNFDLEFMSNEKDICEWTGIVVIPENGSNDIKHAGVFCDPETLFPIHLALPGNNVRGHIPTEIGLLTSLLIVDLESNPYLVGNIPTELCALTNLNNLNLGSNSLVGDIPPCIGTQLTGLKQLALNDNLFEDQLPTELASLTALEQLLIDDNELTGLPLPIFDSLTSLKILMAHHNAFEGFIESGHFAHHRNLEWLDLSDNNFQVPSTGIPRHLFRLSALKVLDLSVNRLSGHIPTELTENTVLQYLSLYGNALNGGIPSELERLQVLVHLDLSDNFFHGPIRQEIGNLKSLRFLYLDENLGFFPGPIPETFGALTQLQDLSLRKTNRLNDLPLWLANMTNLVMLDLSINDFGGTIPEAYGEQLTNLEFIMLNTNMNITGDIPDTFANLVHLRAIFLDGTKISGNVEETICNLPQFVPDDSSATKVVAHANCEGRNPIKSCKCCECCGFGATCSLEHQMAIRSNWQKDFQTLHFQIHNGTSFLDKDYIPPVP